MLGLWPTPTEAAATRFPDALLAECTSAFSEYHSVLQEVEKQGLDEERLKQVLEHGARTHSIITQVAAKFLSRVQVQNN